MIWLIMFSLPLTWWVHSLVCWYRNIQEAKKIGFPTRLLPVSPMNVLWIVSEPLIFGIIDRLPFSLGSLSRYGRRAWHFAEKAQSHIEMGDAFSIVSPGETFIYISDPEAITDLFTRRADFLRPSEMYQMLAVYGSNVSTVDWKDWQRHRKIVAAPFNENTNKLVWSESIAQTDDMLKAWTSPGKDGIQGTAQDTRTLSLDVLAFTGFHESYKFYSFTEPVSEKDTIRGYRESLKVVMDNSILMMILPPRLLSLPFMPRKYARVGQATMAFRDHMLRSVDKERELLVQGKQGTGSLMTSLLRASEGKNGGKALSINQILGNMFVINFAGHDTTANTLTYAVMLLAAFPDVQDWIGEEIRAVIKDFPEWTYEDLFPRLKRCQAILLETIRLYPPIMALPKTTRGYIQTLKINGRQVNIPPNTYVVPSLLAMHTHPKYWRPDPLMWKPSRWIVKTADKDIGDLSNGSQEDLFEPFKGTYFPWSDGPQYCPGKKFAQVEFVAVMAKLFLHHRVRPFADSEESPEQARKRVLAVCEDSEHVLLLRMKDGDSIRLVWENEAEIERSVAP